MTTTAVETVIPKPKLPDSPLFAAYLAGLDEGRIIVPECDDCGQLQWPPREICGKCQSTSFHQVDVPTTGTVYTYTVVYRAFHPFFDDKLPYGVAVVEPAPGVRILARYAGDDPESLECGQELEAVFDQYGPGTGSIAWRRPGTTAE